MTFACSFCNRPETECRLTARGSSAICDFCLDSLVAFRTQLTSARQADQMCAVLDAIAERPVTRPARGQLRLVSSRSAS